MTLCADRLAMIEARLRAVEERSNTEADRAWRGCAVAGASKTARTARCVCVCVLLVMADAPASFKLSYGSIFVNNVADRCVVDARYEDLAGVVQSGEDAEPADAVDACYDSLVTACSRHASHPEGAFRSRVMGTGTMGCVELLLEIGGVMVMCDAVTTFESQCEVVAPIAAGLSRATSRAGSKRVYRPVCVRYPRQGVLGS